MQDPAIKKALTTLEFLSQDEEARRLYDERMKGLQTYMAEIHGAKEEGRKEGDRNARKEVAKKLLQMGLTIGQVVESTSLSQEEIEAIRKELLQLGTAAMKSEEQTETRVVATGLFLCSPGKGVRIRSGARGLPLPAGRGERGTAGRQPSTQYSSSLSRQIKISFQQKVDKEICSSRQQPTSGNHCAFDLPSTGRFESS